MNYLFNGVELPALPEWDKAAYPYVVIVQSDDAYYAYALTEESYLLREINGSKEYQWLKCTAPHLRTVYSASTSLGWAGVFAESGSWDYINSTLSNSIGCDGEITKPVIWSNHNIPYEDGTIFFEKCDDPIPVSTFTPDPISMTMGWLVGRRIAGQRK